VLKKIDLVFRVWARSASDFGCFICLYAESFILQKNSLQKSFLDISIASSYEKWGN